MNKRVARLRREYLYRKSLQGAQKEEYEKKRAVREALQEGKPLPTELRKEANDLKRKVDLEDDNTAVQRTNVDDEYADLGVIDPQVCHASSLIMGELCLAPTLHRRAAEAMGNAGRCGQPGVHNACHINACHINAVQQMPSPSLRVRACNCVQQLRGPRAGPPCRCL